VNKSDSSVRQKVKIKGVLIQWQYFPGYSGYGVSITILSRSIMSSSQRKTKISHTCQNLAHKVTSSCTKLYSSTREWLVNKVGVDTEGRE
jgi:hypothetical protein